MARLQLQHSEAEQYALLHLYFGYTGDIEGLGEGGFTSLRSADGVLRMSHAMDVVRYAIANMPDHINLGIPSIVKHPAEAENVIKYCLQHITGAKDEIKLEDVIHGMVRFNRNIRFEGWKEEQKEDLIKKLNESGYKPGASYDSRKPKTIWNEALRFE